MTDLSVADAAPQPVDAIPQIVGFMPDGVQGDLALKIAREVQAKVQSVSSGVTVRSLRMVPSSMTQVDANTIEFIANATLVPSEAPTGSTPVRAKVIDSVVTVDLRGAKTIRSISVPFFESRSK